MFTPSRLSLLALAAATLGSVVGVAQPPRPKAHPRVRVLVVEEATNSPWKVTVSMDRSDRAYASGDLVSITVRSEQDGYLYLFNQDAAGNLVVLFPNQFQSNNAIRGGTDTTVPSPADATFRIRAVSNTPTTELVKAVVSKEPLKEMGEVEKLARSAALKKSKQWKPPQMTVAKFKRLTVELVGGDPDKVGTNPGIGNQNEQGQVTPPPPPPTQEQTQQSVQQEKDRVQQQTPGKYKEKMQQWATGQIEFTITPALDKPTQDKPGQERKVKPGK